MQSENDFSFYYYLKLLLLFIYLVAPGLSDSRQNLQSSLWHAESLVVACGISFLDQGSSLGLLHWDLRVLITGHQRDPSFLFLAAWALARQNIIIQCHGSSFPLRLSATPIIRAFRNLVPSHPPTLLSCLFHLSFSVIWTCRYTDIPKYALLLSLWYSSCQ